MSGQASFELIMCPRLIGEISDVLDRPRLRKRISEEDAREFIATTSALLNQVADPSEVAVAPRDADDDTWSRWRQNTTLFESSPATMDSLTGRSSALRQDIRPMP